MSRLLFVTKDYDSLKTHSSKDKPKILIVGGPENTVKLIETVLSDMGRSALVAGSAQEALTLLAQHSVAVVFLYLEISANKGHALAEKIQVLPDSKLIPIIFITESNHNDEAIMQSYNSGVIDILHTPIDASIIKTKTRIFLELHQQRKLIQQQKDTLQQAFKKLQDYAKHDQLTGMFNRPQITSILERIIKRAKKADTQVGVMFLDLDHFKLVNDSFGHDTGDLLLCSIAERVKNAVRGGDYVARFGGDEFCIILTSLYSSSTAGKIASRIMDALKQPHLINGHEIISNCSMGIAINDSGIDSASELLKNADTAMYQAKQRGRCQFTYFSKALEQEALLRMELGTKLKTAIEQDQLEVHYQPQFCAKTLKIIGFEALMRWRLDDCYISPVTFISIAEETGQINSLGYWILEAACTQLKQWLERGLIAADTTIAVNVSNRQIHSGELQNQVKSVLQKTRLDAKNLELELTESTVMEDPESTISTFKEMNELGIRISVDDFGTGYSSLAYLKELPLDSLKIDRSFVNELLGNDCSKTIVRAIIGLSHNLGLKVVAEGVETTTQQNFLTNNGCDTLQGFLFSKPLNSLGIEKLISKPEPRALEISR